MSFEMTMNKEYKSWILDIKQRVRSAQIKAVLKVNTELINLYWALGCEIVAKQANFKWGEGFLFRLSKDLMAEFPEIKGFLERNLKYTRQWYLFYNQGNAIGQQAVAQIIQITWGTI